MAQNSVLVMPPLTDFSSNGLKLAASLFAGIGGSDLGLIGDFYFLNKYYPRNPFRVVFANDIDKYVVDVHRLNFGDHIVHDDLKNIESDRIPDIDIVTGGFPCQPFSMSARPLEREEGFKDRRGNLFFEMARVIRDKQPSVFIAENVKGILSTNGGRDFQIIVKTMENIGYTVSWKVLNAADFGVPQRRERVFIVGVRKDLGLKFRFPTPAYSQNPEGDSERWVPLKEIIDVHPPNPKYIFSERAVKGLLNANPRFNKGRAQNLDQPCATISAHLAKVSLNSTDPVIRLPGKRLRFRRFSPREAACIQSFPENFRFIGSDLIRYRQIGNAIPPVLFWYLSRAVYEQVFLEKPLV